MNATSKSSDLIRVEDLRNLIGEIRMMARSFLSAERVHSFTPTALAMTALRRAKLSEQDWSEVRWENRAHFFAALSTAMRHALIDHARRRRARGREKVLYFPPDEDLFRDLPAQAEERPERFIVLDEALARLTAEDQRLAESIQQFYFLGYTIPEIASLSGLSEKTIDRDLKRARTVLRKYLDELPTAA
jgi:RNA polymerase sigma factor (TIGR02999 family)